MASQSDSTMCSIILRTNNLLTCSDKQKNLNKIVLCISTFQSFNERWNVLSAICHVFMSSILCSCIICSVSSTQNHIIIKTFDLKAYQKTSKRVNHFQDQTFLVTESYFYSCTKIFCLKSYFYLLFLCQPNNNIVTKIQKNIYY